jgi:serine/threonine protein kinase
MASASKIQTIQPSRVTHELISKPLGCYIIRTATENDAIVSRVNNKSETNSRSYVVLSVRVDEETYQCPLMHYRLQLEDLNSVSEKLPELTEQCVIDTEDTNWEFDKHLFQTTYSLLFSKDDDSNLKGKTTYNGEIGVFNKTFINDEQNFQRELSVLQNLSYFHIVSFYGICSESEQIKSLVFGDNGESLKIKYPDIKYTDGLMCKQLATIGYQIACGMIYLEYKNIIHRDLHAGNILIDGYNFVRIADFGHAVRKDEDDQSIMDFQPRRRAPECLPSPPENGESVDTEESLLNKFSSKSDVWAYGLIFMELIEHGEDVYPYIPIKRGDAETIQFVEHVKVNRNIHEKPINCPDSLYDVLKRCWDYCPEDRISFVDIRNEMMKLFES